MAAGLAVQSAEAGARVLAIDATNDGGLDAALGGRTDLVEVLELSTEAALDQYLDLYLPLPISPSRIGPLARIFDYVANAAPGVREILALGKVAHEAAEGPWDLVVVDSPATGHVVELLAAADNLGDLIGLGPLAEQTAWITDLVADAERSSVLVVATPEELPVVEAVELLERLKSETRVAVQAIVLNRVPPEPTPSAESRRLVSAGGAMAAAVESALAQAADCRQQRQQLVATGLSCIEVPESDDPVGDSASAFRRFGSSIGGYPVGGRSP